MNSARVVLDTNVYILAILFGGNPEKIRGLSNQGEIVILVSEAILKEIAEILRRKFGWQNWQISETLEEIREFTVLVIPQKSFSVIKKDESDNRILECAVESEARFIVSGDKHLLNLKEYRNIKILSPKNFLTYFNQ